ncbi:MULTISPECIES: hypothetical protein [Glutamicibacter]|uniref:YtxH domain-containing protein n=1 Tax=Glutamicibacter halophytocola TaxID=1933880 RepID=A0A5B8IGN6_9MICC|nr:MULTISPECIES: hypothetical protein [Glutamicibacter]ALG29081.1 hypothetical protein AOZ07_08885 [Glutamicibacter halophytocola]MBF6671793.1 hypothetical protein [Glutamicibacter sp. FBE19]NQD39656.1 hypothetical protein [Glutamicibacter halophytocola]QDY65342.1 hypothetical protein FQA45_02925 [Glutamicibacter halophytocola]UUX60679.1 hypothetical protein NUH22_08770 [Glutamicibacter halophytocola]
MKKFLWVSIGVGVGVLATRKYADVKSGAALNRQVGKYADRVAEYLEAFHQGMTAREEELRSALGVDAAK